VSCRVIGRKIEYAFLDYVLRKTKEIGIDEIKAKYITTRKNEQVKEFYDKYSFELINESDTLRNYTLDLSQYDANRIDYIEVVNGK